MKRYLKILATGIFLALPWVGAASAQQVNNYCLVSAGPPLRWEPCSATNPLAVNASVSASITGFPGTTQTTGTPIAVTTGGVTGTLPAGTVVVANNVGATNDAYCKLGASASTSDQLIPPKSWFGFTVGTNTQLTCITSTSTTTVNMVGGAGLPTGAGGGSSGGGSNAAAGATGSSVPASASYNGLNIGGNLRGQTGVNPTGSVFAAQTDLSSVGGTSYALGQQLAAASMPVVLTAAQITTLTPPTTVTVTQATSSSLKGQVDPLTIGTWALAASTQNGTTPTNGGLIMGQFNTTPTTITSGNISPIQMDAAGNVLVNVKAGGAGGGAVFGPTAVGAANANPPVVFGGTTTGAAGQNVVGAAIKLASTAPVATDTSVVTTESPNSPLLTSPSTALAATNSKTNSYSNAATDSINTNLNGSLYTALEDNVTATDCSGTVTTGGTAVNAFTAQTKLRGFTIVNIDTSEPMWISFTGTAAASTAGSYPIQAATATTFAGPGSFTAPPGFGLNHALSVIAATSAHKFSCTWW